MNAAESNNPPATENAENSSRGSVMVLVVVLLIIAAVLAVFGILKRKHADAELKSYTNEVAAPPVSLAKPVFEKNTTEIVLPGNIQAYTLAPIYARTAGYVKAWYHDIGSHVRKGDLLAVIETPELDQQLAHALRCAGERGALYSGHHIAGMHAWPISRLATLYRRWFIHEPTLTPLQLG